MKPITITVENFESEVMKSDKPVLLDFWAEWCGPCKMLLPVMDEVAAELDDVKIGKVNVDEQRQLAEKFGVMSIPMLILIKNGEVMDTSVGARPKQQILEMLGK